MNDGVNEMFDYELISRALRGKGEVIRSPPLARQRPQTRFWSDWRACDAYPLGGIPGH